MSGTLGGSSLAGGSAWQGRFGVRSVSTMLMIILYPIFTKTWYISNHFRAGKSVLISWFDIKNMKANRNISNYLHWKEYS